MNRMIRKPVTDFDLNLLPAGVGRAPDFIAATCAAKPSMIDLKRGSDSSTSLLTQAWAQLAPNADVMNPTGR